MENHALLANIFRKHEIILREEFNNDRDYERAVKQLVASIVIVSPVNKDGTQPGESRLHWTLRFESKDAGKWLAAIAEVRTANKNVQNGVKVVLKIFMHRRSKNTHLI